MALEQLAERTAATLSRIERRLDSLDITIGRFGTELRAEVAGLASNLREDIGGIRGEARNGARGSRGECGEVGALVSDLRAQFRVSMVILLAGFTATGAALAHGFGWL